MLSRVGQDSKRQEALNARWVASTGPTRIPEVQCPSLLSGYNADMRKTIAVLLSIAVSTAAVTTGLGCLTAPPAPLPANDWPVAAPEETGFPKGDLESAVESLTARGTPLTSLIVVKDGYLVYEGYWNGFSPGEMTALYSATKSINALVTGIAIDRGILPDERVTIADYLSGYVFADPLAETITLEDVLTMRTGFDYDEWTLDYGDPDNAYNRWLAADDRIAFVLSLSMAEEPGSVFRYQTPASQLVPRVVEEAAAHDFVSLAAELLFEPLGIAADRYIWRLDAHGHARVAACNMVPADLARIGLLVLRGGEWDGTRLVSEEWLDRSLSPAVGVRYGVQFGYHWWLREANGTSVFGAEGYRGQCLFIAPEFDLVVVTTGDFRDGPEGAFRLVKDNLLPLLEE